ncbi:patatin-like phospholipase family protein [Bacillus cytotoxicus]|uniref:patatin-like phospholipase family protein n=1 Tax=Bacillus cytotoxicus TaxID=580165 RepID=UPI004054F402
MKNIGLVLEGGGMKGLYTAGVLEYFMENVLFFPYVVGVSAGACMGATYLSRQKGRNKKVNIELVCDHRYISYRNFIKKRELFGMDFLFDEVPNKLVPFDFQAFMNAKEQFVIGTTDCESGQALYYNKHEHGNDILKIIRASSSVPFIAPAVEYGGRKLLDGGIIDPIPVRKAQDDGFQKNVVIMTKPAGYRKHPNPFSKMVKCLYRRYPKVANLLAEHYQLILISFNSAHRKMKAWLNDKKVTVLFRRIHIRNGIIIQLIHLYNLGYEDAKRHYKQLLNWIEK